MGCDDYRLGKFEERGYPGVAGVAAGGCVQPIYHPHKFQPTQTGLSGAPCAVCGGLPTDPSHQEEPMDKDKALEIQNEPAVWVERIRPDAVTFEICNIPNEQAMRVVQKVLPDMLELYLKKSRDYGGNVMDRFGLGAKAAIPDLARKFGKLIDAIWHDKPLQFEQPEEVLKDLFGHIVIILDQRSQGE